MVVDTRPAMPQEKTPPDGGAWKQKGTYRLVALLGRDLLRYRHGWCPVGTRIATISGGYHTWVATVARIAITTPTRTVTVAGVGVAIASAATPASAGKVGVDVTEHIGHARPGHTARATTRPTAPGTAAPKSVSGVQREGYRTQNCRSSGSSCESIRSCTLLLEAFSVNSA